MTSILPTLRHHVTWAAVEDGFHVASRVGEFVGFAERTTDGHFVAFDSRSTPVGRYESLDEAQRAVEDAPVAGDSEMSPRTAAAMQTAAAISGMVALGALAVAMATLPGI